MFCQRQVAILQGFLQRGEEVILPLLFGDRAFGQQVDAFGIAVADGGDERCFIRIVLHVGPCLVAEQHLHIFCQVDQENENKPEFVLEDRTAH